MNKHIFRAYDIRGEVQRDFTPTLVERIGQAMGTMTRRQGEKPCIAVGRDARLSSPMLRDAVMRGIEASGCDTIDLGIVPTPLLYFAVHTLDVGAGVMVTGSHNPPQDNGFKLMIGKNTLHGEGIAKLATLVASADFEVRDDGHAGRRSHVDIVTPYFERVKGDIGLGERRLKLVVDAGNGPTGPIAPSLLADLGCDVVPLFCELDGNFPNHHPDPTVEANLADLRAAVAAHGADLGVAYDGDGDRIGVIDEKGGILWGDQLMVLLSRALLAEEPGATIVGEVKCSQTLFDDIAAHGGRPIMSRVGHSLIKDRMKSEGALLAGEMSGHIFYKHRWYGFDDAIYTTCRLLELLSRTEAPLSSLLADVPPTCATPELRVECPDSVKFDVVSRVTTMLSPERHPDILEVIDIDGVRVRFADGWGLVRASNTGPVLVLRAEADSEAGRDRIHALLVATIAAARTELSE